MDAWLDIYQDCPDCESPFGNPELARESIESQIQACREHFEAQGRLSSAANEPERLSHSHAMKLSDQPEADSSSALENVLAALTLLGVAPSEAKNLDRKDLDNALSLMDLRDENTIGQLSKILESLAIK